MKEFIVSYETEQIENSEFFYGGKIESELIRCKDCKWNREKEWVDCYMSGMHGRNINNFCSRAERKEE